MDGTTGDFHATLTRDTADARAFLLSAPVIGAALKGTLTVEQYRAFLTQAYHHVRHTLPLLLALGGRLPDHHAALRKQVVHYCEEEIGHEQWILDDLRATGADPAAAARSTPHPATDAMVAYAWDTVQRRNPVGFFGMVFVLEGTSVALALQAADRIQATLGLPATAFRYLRSHGQLDQEHVQHLAGILAVLTDPADRTAVRDCARAMYWLYGQVFRSLDAPPA
jgi:pyrroloquinoline quinone (PQQ) biosynthesis protein C